MRTAYASRIATISPKWLLALLAPALVVGIVAMHGLLVQTPVDTYRSADTTSAVADPAAHDKHAPAVAEMAGMVGNPDGGDPGTEGGMSDCTGLMAICLALLVSFVGLLLWPRGTRRWALWQRPPPNSIHLGRVRLAFEALTPLQRTTVLRC